MPGKDYLYSIRNLTEQENTCTCCDTALGPGPTGFRDNEPLCELCMIDDSPRLGIVLMLVAMARACTQGHRRYPAAPIFVGQLMVFARLFDNVFRREGIPSRFPRMVAAKAGNSKA